MKVRSVSQSAHAGQRGRVFETHALDLALGAFFLAGVVHPAAAQTSVIERNLPPAPAIREGAITLDDAIAGSQDRTSLGVDLTGVTLLGANEDVPAGLRTGSEVELRGVDPSYEEAARAALAPYLGQPLSSGLIADLQSAVAGVWREAGRPFVSVTVPPQEVTGGTLALRVIEFSAGQTTSDDPRLPRQIRQQSGALIDAEALSEDLAWLNRNPYRTITAEFSPGEVTATSDIALVLSSRRPFSIYAGWDNSGGEGTGQNRYYIGGGAWLPQLNDVTLAFQYTRSGEIFEHGDPFVLDEGRPGYLSAAGRIDLPTLPRQALSLAPNYVETMEFVGGTPFSFRNRTIEVPVLYRSALSNLLPGRFWGDIYAGISFKRLSRTTRFAGIDVAEGEAELAPLVLGWSHLFSDGHGRTEADLSISVNPGGILGGDSAAHWRDFTAGRVDDNRFAHLTFDINRTTFLPDGFIWTSLLSGRLATEALPDTERLGIAGLSAVRGYRTSEGAGDAGAIWRNELRLPTLRPLAQIAASAQLPSDRLSPFFFLDAGFARDIASRETHRVAGTGVGFDYAVGTNLNAGFTAGMALIDAGKTRVGDWTLNASFRLNY